MKKNILIIIGSLLYLSLFLQCSTSKRLNHTGGLEEKAARTLIITYENESVKSHIKNIIETYKASISGSYDNLKIISVCFSKRNDAEKAMNEIKKIKGVKSVEKDSIVSIQ